MRVNEIMSKPVVSVPEDAPLETVAKTMLRRGIGCVVVKDSNGQAAGILTERDFIPRDAGNPFNLQQANTLFGRNVRENGMEALYADSRIITARKAMRPIATSLRPEDPVERAAHLMARHEIIHVPVIRDGKAIGMVSRHDLLQLVAPPSSKKKRSAGAA